MRTIFLGLVATTLCTLGGLAFANEAADYPNRPIRLIVPFAAGGPADLLARRTAQSLEGTLKQSVVVENRTGAGSTIGTNAVARSDADGYTLLWATFSHSINATLYKNLPYDSLNDFAPVSPVVNTYLALAATPSAPGATVQEFIRAAKKDPKDFAYGSAGVGSGMHLAAAMFNSQAGLPAEITHVPYRGGSQVVPALLGNEVRYAFLGMDQAVPLARDGKVKILAVTSPQRDPLLPDVPTLQEAGLKDFDVGIYLMVLAPKDTPAAIVEKLNQAINTTLQSPDFVKATADMAGVVRMTSYTPEKTRQFMRHEIDRWAPIIKASGASID